MKRARDPTDDPSTIQDNALDGNQRITPGFINLPPAAATADDDDPYGFGNVGAPGFISKPTSMKSGYVPGYIRIPGSAGTPQPAGLAVKSARTAVIGAGAKPTSVSLGGFIKPQSTAEAAISKPLPVPELNLLPPVQLPLSPVSAVPEDSDTALMLQRRRVQNKELPEQHRLPDDLPAVVPGKIAKTSASASGPLSPQIKILPKFYDEIQTFVEQSIPNQAEQLTKAAAFERIKPACLAPFPRDQYAMVHVQPFGSYANGLSLAASDIDAVITGVTYPDDGRGGYIKETRKPVTDHLFRVVKQLRAEHAVARGGSALQIVAGARIPIIRLTTVEGVEVDISLGSDDGVKAAEIIRAKIKEYPEAKALTIVLKAFLKARRLTDVSQGGLGGYSLVNMVIAHLQEEKKGGGQTADLGQLLMGFFRRFGSHFNLYTDAVAIGSGGICPKKDVCQFEEDVLAPKLCVQDISTLRDVASGSKRITEVNEAFHSSAETLEQQAKTYGDEAPADGWLQLLFETTPFTMREATEIEQELPQQSGRPNIIQQPRPHIMMAKSQPKQHGEPGFMMRKSSQPNQRGNSQQGFAPGKKQNNSYSVIVSPRPGGSAKSPVQVVTSPTPSLRPISPLTSGASPVTMKPGLSPPSAVPNAVAPVSPVPPRLSTTSPYGGPAHTPPSPYNLPRATSAIPFHMLPSTAAPAHPAAPAAATLPYSVPASSYAMPAAYPAASAGMHPSHLPPNLSDHWPAAHAAHPYSMAAYQYQVAQQMSAQMSSYMMAQSLPMAYPTATAKGPWRPPGPRPPPGSPPPRK